MPLRLRMYKRRKSSVRTRILATQTANLIGYWGLGDSSGTTADDVSATNADGTYAGTFTLGQPGIGDGYLSTLFDGTSGRVSLATNLAALDVPFDGAIGSMFCWVKVSGAGVWTDATSRVFMELGADASNRVYFNKTSVNNRVDIFYNAGGVSKQTAITSFSSTSWFSLGITWNKASDRVLVYQNGIQAGSMLTGLGVWVGALASGFSALAHFNSAGGAGGHDGYMAHAAVWNSELTAAEMLSIGVL